MNSILNFWFQLTAVPEPTDTATFIQKEQARRMRSLSYAVGTIWIIFILFIPGCFVIPNPYVIYIDLGMMPICLIALFINKKFQKPVLAGALVTFCFEVALVVVCLTSWPFDEPSLQQYELFVLGEIMALTLVSPRGMIAVGMCNAIFITCDLLFQPHTAALNADLHTQFAAILIRPVSLQIMVALVVSLNNLNLIKTTQRANQAQMKASLEHDKVEQEQQRNEEMRQLNEWGERITEQYATMQNMHKIAKIEIPDIPSFFLPVVKAFNMVLTRLQRAQQAEHELYMLNQAIQTCTEEIYQGRGIHEHVTRTGTPIDPLLAAIREQGRLQAKKQVSSTQFGGNCSDLP